MARLNNEVERSHDSPMDYAWNDGRGPVDASSPFMQASQGSSSQHPGAGHKRPSSELESPYKADLPKLRNPEGQRWLFNTMPANKTPWEGFNHDSAFTTPRKLVPEMDDTSGAEQSSPAYAGDSEATPDPPRPSSPTKALGALVKFKANKESEKASQRSNSSNWFKKSGKGSMFKRSGYNDLLQRKVDKRRRRQTDKDVQNAPRRYSNDSDDEERPSSSDDKQPAHRTPGRFSSKMGFIPSVLTFIDEHPSLPSTLSYYVQFILNCVIAIGLVVVLWGIFATIKNDINERAMMESSGIMAEIAICAQSFTENKCERGNRVPAMENACNTWESCMNRDPKKVGRSRLSASMFAEIFNSFIEPISVKALVVSVLVIVGCFAANNLTFGIYRSKHNPPPPPAYPPPTPSQSAYLGHQSHPQLGFSSPGYGQGFTSPGFGQLQHPYQQHLHGFLPPNGGSDRHEDGSPSKRLGYR